MNNKERFREIYLYLTNNNIVKNQRDFADKIEANVATISLALAGKEKYLTKNLFVRVAATFPNTFNNEWLLTGEGEMLKGESKKNETNDDVVVVPRKFFEQLDRLTQAVLSQQRTIEHLTKSQPYFTKCVG